jgi:radical SAM protein with 4Fe4S-binding SPASM domain
VIVHPDGLLASCYLVPSEWDARGMDLSIGRVLADGQVEVRARDVLRLRRLIHSKPRCSRCFCRLSCAGGCHVNNSYPGCPDQYGDFCQSTRILTACGLLEEIGESERADELVCDRDALERLSAPRSDRVIDFEDAG